MGRKVVLGMEDRIQFRVDAEIKELAQKAAKRKGYTLSDACRLLAENFAAEQREFESHDEWLINKVNHAFAAFERGENKLLSKDEVDARLARKRAEMLRRFGK